MAFITKTAPCGFGHAVEQMNLLTPEILADLSNEVIQFLQYKIGAMNTEKWKEKVKEEKKEIDVEKIQSVINALIHIFREASCNRLTADQFMADLALSMVFSDPVRSVLSTTWSQQGTDLVSCDLRRHILGVGQLVDIQWKVGVAMSSDSCRQLNSPFVTLTLTVADTGGNLKTHPLELTMDQFRNFTNQLKEIGKVIELV